MVLKVTLTWHWKLNIILFSDFRESHSQDGMQYIVQLGISEEVKKIEQIPYDENKDILGRGYAPSYDTCCFCLFLAWFA